MSARDIEFLYEIGSLRNIPRAWIQHLATDCASTLEHTLRVVFLALLIARKEGVKDEETIIKMALIHDLAEARTADLAYVHKVYTTTDDLRAAHDQFAGTAFPDLEELLKKYEKRDSIEAKIVKDADNLDIDLEMKEVQERGSLVPGKKGMMRRFVRDKKLYTKTAKKIWDEIQTSDPSSWHLKANKWKRMPSAGK
jgi:putative hydrolase of HD superfamily